jgi:flagellar motor switch/type III secretory pathway protein FliN
MPEECLRDARVARAAGQAASAWARAWFAQASWDAVGAWAPEDGTHDGWSTLREGGRIALRARAGAILDIAFAMLGEPARGDLTTRDLRLLRRLAGDALDDLLSRLEDTLPDDDAGSIGPEQERWGRVLAMDGEPILRVSLDRADVCLLARRAFGPTHAAGGLDRASVALAGVEVSIAAQIGRASLAIDEIGALEPGDILVLDREVNDPVDLVVAGRKSPLRCSLTDVDGAMGLIVCDPQ